MDIFDMGYIGEEIKLGGKVRHLKYPIPALKIIARKYGSYSAGLEKLNSLNPEFDFETLDVVASFVHAGLVHQDKSITFDDVELMIGIDNINYTFKKILAALTGSNPESSGGSDATPGEQKSTST